MLRSCWKIDSTDLSFALRKRAAAAAAVHLEQRNDSEDPKYKLQFFSYPVIWIVLFKRTQHFNSKKTKNRYICSYWKKKITDPPPTTRGSRPDSRWRKKQNFLRVIICNKVRIFEINSSQLRNQLCVTEERDERWRYYVAVMVLFFNVKRFKRIFIYFFL